jgi:PadR family transcriptional regulator, regulatory protein AphA
MCPMVRRPLDMELALLGFLRSGPQHGYQLHQQLADPAGLGPVWRLKQSHLYAMLKKLEQDGYIQGELGAQDTAYPPRRVFHLTAAGEAAYQEWLQSPVESPRLMRQEFLAKLYFTRQEGPEVARALIVRQRTICHQWLAAKNTEAAERPAFNWLVHQYRLSQIEAALAWLDTCEQSLR